MTTDPSAPTPPDDAAEFDALLNRLELLEQQDVPAAIMPASVMSLHDALEAAIVVGKKLLPRDKFSTANAVELARLLFDIDVTLRHRFEELDAFDRAEAERANAAVAGADGVALGGDPSSP